jgi:hypothetical protein
MSSIEFLARACALAQGFLSDGCIDGTPETPDALYAALQPFVDADEEAGSEAFVRALATIVASRERDEAAGRSPDGADEDGVGSGGGCESALGSTEGGATCAVQQPPGWPRAAAERESATEPAQPTSASASTPSQAPGDSRNPESSPRRALLEGGSVRGILCSACRFCCFVATLQPRACPARASRVPSIETRPRTSLT